MKTEDLKRVVLKTFKGQEFYGYEAHKRLASEDIKIEISRLYGVLNEMLREGLLDARWEKSKFGPRKRLYRIGQKGREELDKILLDAIATVHSFYGDYLLNLPPESNVFDALCKPLIDQLRGPGCIAYVTPKYSTMHERFMHNLHKGVPQAKIYLVKPKSVMADLKLDDVLLLDGGYDDVPFKEGYLDLLISASIPPKDSLETTLKEWQRVLKPSGTLAIFTPTVILQKYKDPLSIGEFVEKYEHETSGKGQYVTEKFLRALLKRFFQKIEVRQVVHITVFLMSGHILSHH